ncbi:MAG: CinA family protein [Oscillospiraceae bacterium]|nr:CinA family protein [Oscillospiraceae bacterium]
MSIETLAEKVVNELKKNGLKVAFAESCTGGMLSSAITSVAGSSDVLEVSVTTYANRAKIEYTDVTEEILSTHGAVSEQTAVLMATGIRKRAKSDIGIGITGLAGPGGDERNPVGTVYISIDSIILNTKCQHFVFEGNRQKVREQATIEALKMIEDCF